VDQSVDVVRIHPSIPTAKRCARNSCPSTPTTTTRCASSSKAPGAFYLRNDDTVLKVVCEQGDLLSVPKHTRHWFDMGPRPLLRKIPPVHDAGRLGASSHRRQDRRRRAEYEIVIKAVLLDIEAPSATSPRARRSIPYPQAAQDDAASALERAANRGHRR